MKITVAVAILVVLLAAPAFAQDGLDMERVLSLRDQGKPYYEASVNTDLSPSERNENRKKAYEFLHEAYRILDAWCDDHPEDIDRLEDLCIEIGQMCYWLRKESPKGLLEGDEPPARRGPPPGWPPAPPPDLKEPALPEPGTGPVPARPEPKAEPAPNPVEEHLKYAEEYAKRHPYDLPGLRDIYLDSLDHAAPGGAAYVTALKKLSELSSQMKDWYRRLRDEDPDQLEMSGAEERRLVFALAKDLKDKEPDVRLRGAEYLGLRGSGDAARHLVAQVKREREVNVRKMIFASLEKIGGSKELATLRKEKDEEVETDAIRVLDALIRRSEVEARYAAAALGEFVFSKVDSVADLALGTLESLGPKGTLGLVNAITIPYPDRKLRVIRALGDTGDGRAAAVLGNLLIFGAKGQLLTYRTAAIESLKKIGRPAVPYLAPAADHPKLRQFAKYVLREITGLNFESGDAVRAWWSTQGR